MTSSDLWDEETAQRYDESSAEMFAPDVLGPTVDLLADLAGDGRALELAVGTGRVAVPLAARGVPVAGIELSEPMVGRLRRKVGEATVPVVVGDMATTRVPGEFALVYLVFNTLGNLRTQAEQVACFRNAARHLVTGGRFVIELGVPALRRFPPGQVAVPFDLTSGTSASTPTTWPPSRPPRTTTGRTPTARSATACTTSATSGPPSAT